MRESTSKFNRAASLGALSKLYRQSRESDRLILSKALDQLLLRRELVCGKSKDGGKPAVIE